MLMIVLGLGFLLLLILMAQSSGLPKGIVVSPETHAKITSKTNSHVYLHLGGKHHDCADLKELNRYFHPTTGEFQSPFAYSYIAYGEWFVGWLNQVYDLNLKCKGLRDVGWNNEDGDWIYSWRVFWVEVPYYDLWKIDKCIDENMHQQYENYVQRADQHRLIGEPQRDIVCDVACEDKLNVMLQQVAHQWWHYADNNEAKFRYELKRQEKIFKKTKLHRRRR
ncbi:MAG: hypothetical protein Q4E16_01015 [Neisseria sp.]|nr:hypothetical protein [Neisseria sp.]